MESPPFLALARIDLVLSPSFRESRLHATGSDRWRKATAERHSLQADAEMVADLAPPNEVPAVASVVLSYPLPPCAAASQPEVDLECLARRLQPCAIRVAIR